MMISRSFLSASLFLLLFGCRGPGGPDDYQSQEIFVDASMPIETELRDGEERLSLGLFYEGPATELYPVDNLKSHFYIYEDTFSLTEIESDRIEGSRCSQIRYNNLGWWGGGIHWDESRDLSKWSTLHISLKSTAVAFQELQLAMNNSDTERTLLKVSDYGYQSDGQWHSLEIPLVDFINAGADLEAIQAPLVFDGKRGEPNDLLLVDGVYFSN